MLLPLLLLIGFGGAAAVHAIGLRSAVGAASLDALRTVEDQGGVTSSLAASLSSELSKLTGTAVTVGGTAPGHPWGAEVCLKVDAPSRVLWPTGGLTVQLGGSYCGKSDLPPVAP